MHLCRARNHWNLSGPIQEVAQTTSDQLRLGAPHSKMMLGLGFRVRVYGRIKKSNGNTTEKSKGNYCLCGMDS